MDNGIYQASAPAFTAMLRNMHGWLDKAAGEGDAADLVTARLTPDMRPLPAQFQMASDTAKNAMARLTGTEAPSMPDTETSFAELQARCERTIAYIDSVDPAALTGADMREIVMKFPSGTFYRWNGADYLRNFALPNFYFHASMAYAILRAAGVALGKPDYLLHLGPPETL
jgi:uncharacterized protein